MKQFWELSHIVTYPDGYHEFVRTIGIFSSKMKAVEAMELVKKSPGFIEYPANFYTGTVSIDTDDWREGFIDD